MTVTSAAAATPTEGAATAPSKETPSSEEHVRDAKGPDVLFLETETGIAYVGLQTLHVKRDVVPTSTRDEDVGGFFGLMAGMKLLFLSVGPHARFGRFRDWDTWSLDLDVGFHAPVGPLEPFLRLGGGYTRLSRAFDKVPSGGSMWPGKGAARWLTRGAQRSFAAGSVRPLRVSLRRSGLARR